MIPLHALLTLLLIATPSVNSAHVDLYTDPAYSSLYPDSTVYFMGTIGQNSTMTFANFEIELQWTDVIPYLYSESGIDVLGNVQQTPRYNTSGEAWVDGVQVDFAFYDATLVDRFVINCTSEKAINMSTHAWVEWTAPILEGTIYSQLPPDEELGIFFEYGAESGVLQPPWDYVGPLGGGSKTESYVRVDNLLARTGTRAVKIYQIPPPKSDAQRRVGLYLYGSSHNRMEFYMSWWIWFPTGFKDMVNQWANLGGITENWGPSDDPYIYQTTWRFMVTSSGSIIILHRELDTSSHGHSSGQYVQNYYEQWVHLQLYARFSTNGTGIYRAWFNNNLFIEETNLTNDPAAVLTPGETKVNGDAPTMEVQLYTETDNNEIWFYVDDIVAATEKVQETYEVHDE